MLERGNIYYAKNSLNLHRRHDESVTIARFGNEELAEIANMQNYVSKAVGIGPEMEVKAKAYLDELKTQFNLS